MERRNQALSVVLALCALSALSARPLLAQTGGIGPSKGQVAGAVIGIAAVGAAIGIGLYFAISHSHRLTGCAVSGPDGTILTSESDKQTYVLSGDVAGIKPGDRVRVSGKKIKQKSAGTRQYLVEKVSRDYGACKAAAQSPGGAT